jgi:Zn-dependent protease with chaperone function
MRSPYRATAYRYPNEHLILFATLTLVLLVIALTATATLCLSAVFILSVILLSYQNSQALHQALLDRAYPVNNDSVPDLAAIVEIPKVKLQAFDLEVFVAPSNIPNAYTFGLLPPKVIVLHSILFDWMDKDELIFVLGHEMGHVRLGHTWLNSLMGGMAGIPSSFSAAAILSLAFRWWNRACEYSADRAGLLACGKPEKAISALVKLVAGGEAHSAAGLERVLARIEAEDDDLSGNLGELLGTHPMMVRRMEQIRRYAATQGYQRLQILMDRNLSIHPIRAA